MKKIIVLLVLLIIFSFGCMKRNNPLDPYGHSNVSVPQKISDFEGNSLSSVAVELTWTPSPGANGYYIYRSMSMNGNYDRVDNEELNSGGFESFIDHDDTFIARTYYWYKISAYVSVGDGKLEGYRSEPIYVYISQD